MQAEIIFSILKAHRFTLQAWLSGGAGLCLSREREYTALSDWTAHRNPDILR